MGSARPDGPTNLARSLTTMDSSLLPRRFGVALPRLHAPPQGDEGAKACATCFTAFPSHSPH